MSNKINLLNWSRFYFLIEGRGGEDINFDVDLVWFILGFGFVFLKNFFVFGGNKYLK